jgi:hypothetical protein
MQAGLLVSASEDADFQLFLHKTISASQSRKALSGSGDIAPRRAVYLYLRDEPTKWTWFGALPADVFLATSIQGNLGELSGQLIRDIISNIMFTVATGGTVALTDGISWEQALGLAVGMYAGAGKSWTKYRAKPEWNWHFFAVLHRHPSTENVILRPFWATTDDLLPIDKEQVQGIFADVVTEDLKRHPEMKEGVYREV